jgi:hypothetical protein
MVRRVRYVMRQLNAIGSIQTRSRLVEAGEEGKAMRTRRLMVAEAPGGRVQADDITATLTCSLDLDMPGTSTLLVCLQRVNLSPLETCLSSRCCPALIRRASIRCVLVLHPVCKKNKDILFIFFVFLPK